MRGQLAGRLLIIIFSWVGLIAILLLGLLFSKFGGNPATPSTGGVSAPHLETTLNAYLRQTVDMGYGNNVPFAEFIVGEYLQGRKAAVQKQTQTFLSTLPATTDNEIYIHIDNHHLKELHKVKLLLYLLSYYKISIFIYKSGVGPCRACRAD
mgnify:CR=1 FL=1